MTLDYWLKAERFYEFWLILIISLIIFIFIAMIFSFTYMRIEKRKTALILFLGTVATLSITGVIGHYRYHSYLEQAMHVNPLIRDRTPNFIDYTYFSRNEKSYYTGLNDLTALRDMVLYEEEAISESLVYLGKGKHTHYFERSNGEKFRYNRQIEFKEEWKEAELVGSRFFLKDDAFKEIGFMNPENIMFEHIRIPESEKGKEFKAENEGDFLKLENTLQGWNFNQ